MSPVAFAGIAFVLAVAGLLVATRARARRPLALADYLDAVDGVAPSPLDGDIDGLPFAERVLRPLGTGVAKRIGALSPREHLESIHAQLLKAGLSSRMRAEEFVAVEVASVVGGTVLAVALVVLARPPGRIGFTCLLMFPVIGLLAARTWLTRKVEERQDLVRRDLPDVLDMLSLSVQAGLGFEAAIALVADRLPSPLASELALTLREMELGRTRREAFANLKRRTDVNELNTFVSAVIQADALGVPLGKVLQTQSAEMRLRRRQWARERANKLPVKLLFPMLLFIFPAIFVVLLGPAVGPLRDALG